MLWDARFVIGQLSYLRLRLGKRNLWTGESAGLMALVGRVGIWVDEYSKLDPRFHPYALQFSAAAGCVGAAARQLERGNRARAKRMVCSALNVLKPRDWFDRAA